MIRARGGVIVKAVNFVLNHLFIEVNVEEGREVWIVDGEESSRVANGIVWVGTSECRGILGGETFTNGLGGGDEGAVNFKWANTTLYYLVFSSVRVEVLGVDLNIINSFLFIG